MERNMIMQVLGGVRVGIGAALVAAPAAAGRIWVGEDAAGHGTRVFARALGARDVALGAGVLAATGSGDRESAARLVQLGAVADAADMVATLIAARNLQGARRWVMPIVAGAVGIAGVAVYRMTEPIIEEEAAEPDDASSAATNSPATSGPIVDISALTTPTGVPATGSPVPPRGAESAPPTPMTSPPPSSTTDQRSTVPSSASGTNAPHLSVLRPPEGQV